MPQEPLNTTTSKASTQLDLCVKLKTSQTMAELFTFQKSLLYVMGYDFEVVNYQRSQTWSMFKYFANLLWAGSINWPLMDYTIYHINDLAMATASISVSLTNMLTVIKILTFLLTKQKFVTLMAQLEQMNKSLQDPNAKQILSVANKFSTKWAKLYFYSVAGTGSYFMIGPFIKIVWAKISHKEVIWDLPMPMKFMFNSESNFGYTFCYIYIGLSTFSVVLHASAIDGIFIAITTNLRAHFQALEYFIKSNSFLKSEEELQQDISGYVRYHVLLLDLTSRVCDLYMPIIFCQFLMTSLQVCFIIYQLMTHMDSMIVLALNCIYLSAIMLQLFIYCFGGEILRMESVNVGSAVYTSEWHNLPPKFRRQLCLIMLRAQREVVIKAGFYEATLASYMLIIKAALSYTTIMQSLE